jgi:hypothetical protein
VSRNDARYINELTQALLGHVNRVLGDVPRDTRIAVISRLAEEVLRGENEEQADLRANFAVSRVRRTCAP